MAQYRSLLDPSCVAESETVPTQQDYVRSLQRELGVEQTGKMTPELMQQIKTRLNNIGDHPTDADSNFGALYQGLFDAGGLSNDDAEEPLKKAMALFVRVMTDRGIAVPGAAALAGQTGAQFFSSYRGATRGSSGGSVVEVVGGHLGVNSECASLTKNLVPSVGMASGWLRGDSVAGNNDLQPGTAIATFNFASGKGQSGYGPAEHPGGWYNVSHTAIYLGQNKDGIYVLDQYNSSAGAQVRFLKFNDPGAEGGSRYFTINTAGHQGDHVAAHLPPAALKYASINAPVSSPGQPQAVASGTPPTVPQPVSGAQLSWASRDPSGRLIAGENVDTQVSIASNAKVAMLYAAMHEMGTAGAQRFYQQNREMIDNMLSNPNDPHYNSDAVEVARRAAVELHLNEGQFIQRVNTVLSRTNAGGDMIAGTRLSVDRGFHAAAGSGTTTARDLASIAWKMGQEFPWLQNQNTYRTGVFRGEGMAGAKAGELTAREGGGDFAGRHETQIRNFSGHTPNGAAIGVAAGGANSDRDLVAATLRARAAIGLEAVPAPVTVADARQRRNIPAHA